MMLIPRKWSDFQHYKDRSPPWIKLHKTLLSDRAFMTLPIASKALAPLLWLLASESKSESGEFDASTEELVFRLHLSAKEIESGRKPLIDKGFFIVASEALASRVQHACLETETETETETEKRQKAAPAALGVLFDEFWKAYPRKVAKDDARKAFDKRKPTAETVKAMLDAIAKQRSSEQWAKEGGKFIPYPATWLNDGRWLDEEASPGTSLDPDSRAAIEAEGIAKGIGPWDETKEHWHQYKARVRGPKVAAIHPSIASIVTDGLRREAA